MVIRSVWSFNQSDYASQLSSFISLSIDYQKSAKTILLEARINKALNVLKIYFNLRHY